MLSAVSDAWSGESPAGQVSSTANGNSTSPQLEAPSSAGGFGLVAWVHDLDDRASSASCRATARGSRGGAVHRLAVGCAGPARRGSDVVDDPGRAASGPGGAPQAAEPAQGARAAGAGAGRPRRRRRRLRSRQHPCLAGACHQDQHRRLSPRPASRGQARQPVRSDPGRARGRRDRRGEGGHRHRRGGAADGGVRRPGAGHRGAGRGAPARARAWSSTPPRSGSWASGCSRWSAPRRPTPSRARGWRRKRPGPARSPTSRSTTTVTAPATDASGCPPCTRSC